MSSLEAFRQDLFKRKRVIHIIQFNLLVYFVNVGLVFFNTFSLQMSYLLLVVGKFNVVLPGVYM